MFDKVNGIKDKAGNILCDFIDNNKIIAGVALLAISTMVLGLCPIDFTTSGMEAILVVGVIVGGVAKILKHTYIDKEIQKLEEKQQSEELSDVEKRQLEKLKKRSKLLETIFKASITLVAPFIFAQIQGVGGSFLKYKMGDSFSPSNITALGLALYAYSFGLAALTNGSLRLFFKGDEYKNEWLEGGWNNLKWMGLVTALYLGATGLMVHDSMSVAALGAFMSLIHFGDGHYLGKRAKAHNHIS